MAKCPRCGEEIDCLENFRTVVEQFCFDGRNYSYVDTWGVDKDEYLCPECGEVLFTDKRKAAKFLKSK
jgi:predicted RNA-binding Zn-ribbon protein involved in translation (DUF1610 family)